MSIAGRPVIYYSLKTFQDSFIDEIVLVVSPGDTRFCQKEIVEKYGFDKVRHIVEGGKERYHSVAAGLNSVSDFDYVFIHDGARPMVTAEILDRSLVCVRRYGACVAGVRVKDTIKIADREGKISATPNRNFMWAVQTPQVFAILDKRSLYPSPFKGGGDFSVGGGRDRRCHGGGNADGTACKAGGGLL